MKIAKPMRRTPRIASQEKEEDLGDAIAVAIEGANTPAGPGPYFAF